jgi:hypothetical protein
MPPRSENAVLRATTRVRDCSAQPTISIVAQWMGTRRSSNISIHISGLSGVISTRPAAVREGRSVLRFPGATHGAKGARVEATVTANWRAASDGTSCKLALPAFLGSGAPRSKAARGVSRLASGISMASATRPPVRTTLREHVWTCSIDDTEGCRVEVTLRDPERAAERSDNDEDNNTDVIGLVALASVLLAARTGKEGES